MGSMAVSLSSSCDRRVTEACVSFTLEGRSIRPNTRPSKETRLGKVVKSLCPGPSSLFPSWAGRMNDFPRRGHWCGHESDDDIWPHDDHETLTPVPPCSSR